MRPRFASTALIAVLVGGMSSRHALRAADADATSQTDLPVHLAETGLYARDRAGVIAAGVRPFLPQYPLWSDGLTKRRWIALPPGSVIDARAALAWDFPVGTKFWKEFSLNGRKIETRILWKTAASRWEGASYVWDDEGVDATLAAADGVPAVAEIASGRRHSIPSRTDCGACHGTIRSGPLGFNALQLSTDRDPNAIHGEPLAPTMLTLRSLIDEGLITPAPTHFIMDPPRIRTDDPATRSVLGYLAANCAICHNGEPDGAPSGPSLTMRDLLEDADAAARKLFDRPSAWQVPGVAEGHSVVIHRGSPELSALFVRLRSRAPSSQMPLGTVIRDDQAVDAINRWISNLSR